MTANRLPVAILVGLGVQMPWLGVKGTANQNRNRNDFCLVFKIPISLVHAATLTVIQTLQHHACPWPHTLQSLLSSLHQFTYPKHLNHIVLWTLRFLSIVPINHIEYPNNRKNDNDRKCPSGSPFDGTTNISIG